MKKCLIALLFLGASLFAGSASFVYSVSSVVKENNVYYRVTDKPANDYIVTNLYATSPTPSSGYIRLRAAYYNNTQYRHSKKDGHFIEVNVVVFDSSTDIVYIRERNHYDLKYWNNGTSIAKPGEVSPYFVKQVQYNGFKMVTYAIKDPSPYHKRVTVETCPNNGTPTTEWCANAAIDIFGSIEVPN